MTLDDQEYDGLWQAEGGSRALQLYRGLLERVS